MQGQHEIPNPPTMACLIASLLPNSIRTLGRSLRASEHAVKRGVAYSGTRLTQNERLLAMRSSRDIFFLPTKG